MKHFYTLFLFFALHTAYCQNLSGYYITTTDLKVEGQFKESDFLNPHEIILFKKTTGTDFEPLNMAAIKEYGIGDEYKFIRCDVDIDVSSTTLASLSVIKEPVFENKSLFLNVVNQGDATLYSYRSDMGTKYFYSVKSTYVPVTQLVYKEYKLQDNSIGINNMYRQQLLNALKCDKLTQNIFANARYKTSDLKDIIDQYNECKGGGAVTTFKNKKGNSITPKFTVFAGMNFSRAAFSVITPAPATVTKAGPGFGVELAALLPKQTWALLARVNYESFKGFSVSDQSGAAKFLRGIKMDYSYIDMSIGARRIFAINTDNAIFIDALVGLASPHGNVQLMSNTTDVYVVSKTYDLSVASFFDFGCGYTYKGRYGVDLRFDTNRNIIPANSSLFDLKSTNIAINLRYTLN